MCGSRCIERLSEFLYVRTYVAARLYNDGNQLLPIENALCWVVLMLTGVNIKICFSYN